MSKLTLVWMAYFQGGKLLYQFEDEEQTKEHLFKEVLDRQDDLKLFSLINTKSNRIYQIDLENGRFRFFAPGFVASPEDVVEGSTENKYRLIHFRRIEKSFAYGATSTIEELSTSIKYFLGYQYTTTEGKNIKHMAQITDNDEVYLV